MDKEHNAFILKYQQKPICVHSKEGGVKCFCMNKFKKFSINKSV